MADTGTCVITRGETSGVPNKAKYIKFAWTSNASGAVEFGSVEIYGTLNRLVTNPGSTAPTDNYDITIEDVDAVDVLQGLGADRDTANTEQAMVYTELTLTDTTNAALPVVVAGLHTFKVATAGASKVGTAYLYYHE